MRDDRLFRECPAALSDAYKRNFTLARTKYNGAGRYVLPVAATYVTDREGPAGFALADTDYRKRAKPTAML